MDRDGELDKQSKKFEVKQIGHFDIVANRTTSKQKEVDELMTMVEGNLRKDQDSPLVGWVPENNYGKLGFKNSLVNPRFFAKQKWLSKQ